MTWLWDGIRRARVALVLALAVLASVPAGGQQPPGPAAGVDVTRLGPQVGEQVPGFTLPDQEGVPRSLETLMGPKGMLLAFLRSADW